MYVSIHPMHPVQNYDYINVSVVMDPIIEDLGQHGAGD